MGIIIKQSIKNSIYSYSGILLGAIYTIFLIPKVFDQNPDEWGLIQLLGSYVLLFMPFALLGFPQIIIKFWPNYSESNKRGFTLFLFTLTSVGIILFSGVLFIFKESLFFSSSNENSLMRTYHLYFFVFFGLHTLFYFFLYFARVFYKTSFPTFLKDTFIKFWTFLLVVLYWQKFISFDMFFKLYLSGYAMQLLMIYIYLKKNTEYSFSFDFSFFKDISSIKSVLTYGFFSLLTGGATVFVARIDILMINKYIDLSSVAYYSVAMFFITALQVPVRSLATIAVPILSDNLHKKKFENVKDIYSKTAINLLLISSFILLLIVMNIQEFMFLLGEKFGQIKYVILILGIAKIYEIINALNSNIIIISKYYKYDIIFQVAQLIITVISNLIFIPIYGINGAALATGITIVLNTTVKGLFVYKKYKLHPYSYNTLKVMLIMACSILGTIFIPEIINVYFTIGIKILSISLIYFILTLMLNVSNEMSSIGHKVLESVRKNS